MPRVAVLLPQTFMNESGRAVGPARGEYRLDLDQVVAVHDEIDLPFGDVRERKGGGTAGHNGIKSMKASLGSGEFWRVRVGVGRPDTTDPEVVSQHVLSRFTEPRVRGAAADRARRRRRPSGCSSASTRPLKTETDERRTPPASVSFSGRGRTTPADLATRPDGCQQGHAKLSRGIGSNSPGPSSRR